MHHSMESSSSSEQKFRKRKVKEEVCPANTETTDVRDNMSLSELKVKLNEEQVGAGDWKSKLDDDDTLSKSLSPSALSSDASSVHSGRFDTEFNVGQRIEVKDYRTDTWYTAKIMEVDYDDREIFIHYERWSVRFDEWLKWDSQRIRKVRLPPSHHRFKVGEHVLATWSYTKKYPAAVKSVLPDDKYEVLFYDGFAKILKGNRIAKIDPRQIDLLEKMPKEIPRAPRIGTDLDVRNIGTKEERRQKKRRLNVVELLQPVKRRRADELLQSPPGSTDTLTELPSSRRRRRQQPQSASSHRSSMVSAGMKKSADTSEVSGKANADSKSVTDFDVDNIKEEVSEDNNPEEDGKNPKIKQRNDLMKKSVLKVSICDIKMEENVSTDEEKASDSTGTEQPTEGSPNTEKDSNSEQDFTGFDATEMKPVANRNRKTALSLSNKTTSSNLTLPLQMARRISKRGCVPKLKTSLGNLATTPRLSAFPKIKPRGRIYKQHEHNIAKGRSRIDKNRDKYHSAGSDIGSNNVNDFPIRISTVEKINSSVEGAGDKMATDDERNLINERNINNDLLMINSGASTSSNAGSSPGNALSTGVNDAEHGYNDEALPKAGGASDHLRRKGRRIKRSLKKFEEKKSKSWKIANRRKADEEDDPERWNGDVPEGAKPVFIDGGDGKMRQSIIIPDKKLPTGWTKHTIIRKNSSKWDVLLVNPNGRKFRSRKDLRTYYNELNKDYPEDCFDFVVGRTKMTSNLIEMETMAKKQGLSPPTVKTQNKKKESKKSGSDDGGLSSTSPSHVPEGEKRVKTLMPKSKPLAFSDDENIVTAAAAAAAVSAVTTSTVSNASVSSLPHHGAANKTSPAVPSTPKIPVDVTPVSAISNSGVTPDSDGAASWICPKDSCGKHFRKENLLQMHIKHYHPEYNQFLDSAPNVADLAYARTVGEPLDETVGAASFLDKINKYEARRKAKADGTPVGGLSKKNVYSSLRKALLKGLSSKDSSEHSEELGDFITKTEPSPTSLQGKCADGLEHGDTVDGDSERCVFDNERGRVHSNTDDPSEYSNGGGHSTLKELLTGTLKMSPPPTPPPVDDPDPVDTIPDPIESSSLPSTSLSEAPTAVTFSSPTRFKSPVESSEASSSSSCSSTSSSSSFVPASCIQKICAGSFDDSAPDSPITPIGGQKTGATHGSFRFSRNKPLVALEKLNVTTDSNGRILLDKKENDYVKLSEKMSDSVPDINDQELSADVSNCTEAETDDVLKKEEIINCQCGYAEEDGLMIQCDLCLCWQHGFCNNIKQESDVPEKYICCICRNPKRLRSSYKYSYNFDWLKEGKLPTLPFRNQNTNEIQQKESLLKRSHDLVATLLQLQKVVKSLRLKTHIAGKSDHPKLYLWAKRWEKESKSDIKVNKIDEKDDAIKSEDIKKEPIDDSEDDVKDKQPAAEDSVRKGPQAPIPEAPIDLVECRLRLLEHIEDYQLQVESRLTTLESQVVALESQDPDLASDETPDFYPQTKQTVQMLMRDLTTVRKVISLN